MGDQYRAIINQEEPGQDIWSLRVDTATGDVLFDADGFSLLELLDELHDQITDALDDAENS